MPGLSRSGNWNENDVNTLSRINWRASLVPAAAVIPAPIAYIKVVAVKKLVEGQFGDIRIPLSEVKFLDFWKTNDCESIYQGCFH